MLLHSNIENIELHFPTPLFKRKWPEANNLNAKLAALILETEKGAKGRMVSNMNGWQSNDDFLTWESPVIQVFGRWMLDCVNEIQNTYHAGQFKKLLEASNKNINYKCSAWANVNRKGAWNTVHNHNGCHWSGVYYVKAPSHSGDIIFLDPRGPSNMNPTGCELLDLFAHDKWEITPQAGDTIFFPSWLNHFVATNESDEDRISIAFNVRFFVADN